MWSPFLKLFKRCLDVALTDIFGGGLGDIR